MKQYWTEKTMRNQQESLSSLLEQNELSSVGHLNINLYRMNQIDGDIEGQYGFKNCISDRIPMTEVEISRDLVLFEIDLDY